MITLILGILSGVLGTSISNALFSKKPDWQYIVLAILFVSFCVLARFTAALYVGIRKGQIDAPAGHVAITKTGPPARVSLGEALQTAREELVFFGVSAKRSVTDDIFKSALAQMADPQLRIRFLLLDPESKAFEQRAHDEGEPPETWRSDQQTTISRLSAYKRTRGFNVELRFFAFYAIWRAIIVDRETVFVSVFLPGRRGTEASQYRITKATEELAFGIINSYHTAWHDARSAAL